MSFHQLWKLPFKRKNLWKNISTGTEKRGSSKQMFHLSGILIKRGIYIEIIKKMDHEIRFHLAKVLLTRGSSCYIYYTVLCN